MATLLNLSIPVKNKVISIHPWEKTIKHEYANRIKTAHNSIRNPQIPVKKERVPDKDRVQFTVVGDRITKEFIYCVNVVEGLHKYRWKKFDVPIIRGVSTVEWPEVWRSLKVQYGGLTHCLQNSVAVFINNQILGGDQELKEMVENKYIYHLVLDYYNQGIAQFASYVRSSGKPCAYMHISIDDKHVGTLIFMLYSDTLPYTCENFLRLCNAKKGGYSGTPVHRIVKDGWIQCGGFGLKNSDLQCENFSIPHNKRGLLCMANDGRHINCSTQFFVLLQPAPWMAFRYVAFGQLIEGHETLKTIEKVPTWYESPTSNIMIYKSGIFNMECHDIIINKGTYEYIHGHIEDLNVVADMIREAIIERVFLALELKVVVAMQQEIVEIEAEEIQTEEVQGEDQAGGLHATERFLRKKEEIQKQIENEVTPSQKQKLVKGEDKNQETIDTENQDFDVEEYELEETSYQHVSIVSSSLVVRPEIPYYIALTDVPYDGDCDSTFDLKKFLKGHYCLESDIEKLKEVPLELKEDDMVQMIEDESQAESDDSDSLDSEDARELQNYVKNNADRLSFAGGIIKHIAKGFGKLNLFDGVRKSELITDDELRRIRLFSLDAKARERSEKKVSISVPSERRHSKIKRRQTGFVRPEDLERIRVFQSKDSSDLGIGDDDDAGHSAPKVRIAAAERIANTARMRRPTGFVRSTEPVESETEVPRQSVLQRLYDEVTCDDDVGPTLKEYRDIQGLHGPGESCSQLMLNSQLRPASEYQPKNMMINLSRNSGIKSDDSREKFFRKSLDRESYENVLNLQHGKKITRKISSDYVKTIDQIEHKLENSIRSIEFAKTRPALTVSAYQIKNQKYQQEAKSTKKSPSKKEQDKDSKLKGLRLPGDTPLYSISEDSGQNINW